MIRPPQPPSESAGAFLAERPVFSSGQIASGKRGETRAESLEAAVPIHHMR